MAAPGLNAVWNQAATVRFAWQNNVDGATMLPGTEDRVPLHTAPAINRRIRREMERTIAYYAQHPEEIDLRLRELDHEWDIERALQANAASLALAGTALGVGLSRRWLVLPVLVTGFLLQHASQGWCPPLPLLRRLGFRTAGEIAEERYALKALRGDFGAVASGGETGRERAANALDAVRA